jgi:hypothetical protein
MLKRTIQWELAVEQMFLACPTVELFVAQFYPKYVKKKCQFCSEISEEINGILACGGYNLEREK